MAGMGSFEETMAQLATLANSPAALLLRQGLACSDDPCMFLVHVVHMLHSEVCGRLVAKCAPRHLRLQTQADGGWYVYDEAALVLKRTAPSELNTFKDGNVHPTHFQR